MIVNRQSNEERKAENESVEKNIKRTERISRIEILRRHLMGVCITQKRATTYQYALLFFGVLNKIYGNEASTICTFQAIHNDIIFGKSLEMTMAHIVSNASTYEKNQNDKTRMPLSN